MDCSSKTSNICNKLQIESSYAVPRDITDFFPKTRGNLTKVTWAHAVNSQNLLKTALNSDVMMLEADIVLGKLNNNGNIIPIMAHPPANTSDLSLSQFITKVQAFNQNPNEHNSRKGIKLDFKSIESFEGSLSILKENYRLINFPLWLNADILSGPLDATITPVDPNRFLQASKQFENVTLSIGWTTRYGNQIRTKYTLDQVEEMFEVIKINAVEQPITVPVRAGIAAESFIELKELLFFLPQGATLTIWHSRDNDYVNIDKLRLLINSLGVCRVFIDVPKDMLEKLHLDT